MSLAHLMTATMGNQIRSETTAEEDLPLVNTNDRNGAPSSSIEKSSGVTEVSRRARPSDASAILGLTQLMSATVGDPDVSTVHKKGRERPRL